MGFGIGINLKALVLKTAMAGVDLTMCFERRGRVVLRARRGNFSVGHYIELYEVSDKEWEQGEQFERIVDEMICRLNDAEKQMIETGGNTQ